MNVFITQINSLCLPQGAILHPSVPTPDQPSACSASMAGLHTSLCCWVKHSIFYSCYLTCFHFSSKFEYIFDWLYSFLLFPCMYKSQVIISSPMAMVMSTLEHSKTILLWSYVDNVGLGPRLPCFWAWTFKWNFWLESGSVFYLLSKSWTLSLHQ